MNNKLTYLAGFMFCIIIGCTPQPKSSDLFASVPVNKQITSGCKTYAFLLSPSFDTKTQFSSKEWSKIAKTFEEFGASLGSKDCAVWLYDNNKIMPSASRSRRIIDIISTLPTEHGDIDPNSKLILVITNINPEDFKGNQNNFYTAVEFHTKNINDIIEVLNFASQNIRHNNTQKGILEIYNNMRNISKYRDSHIVKYKASVFPPNLEVEVSPQKQ